VSEKDQIGNTQNMWHDPDPTITSGVLLSDRIQFYAEQVDLITPFEALRLGPASYDLSVGNECWYAEHLRETGEAKRTLATGERIVLPPNSITFVSTRESLNMPFYLAARFNLKLRLLHEGLLLGAGPQIDPGFSGRLSCPLHNISSEKISLTAGEPFAVIEFHKTSRFAELEAFPKTTTLADVRRRGEQRLLKGVKGYPCLTFPTQSLNREPIKRYVPPGRLVSSSVEGIATAQKMLRESVERTLEDFAKRMRNVNTLAYIGVVAVALSIAAYFFAVVNWNKGVNDAAVRAEEHVKHLETENSDLRARITQLERQVANLNLTQRAATETGSRK
jgi:deoxycytidine triphosphate deaminase